MSGLSRTPVAGTQSEWAGLNFINLLQRLVGQQDGSDSVSPQALRRDINAAFPQTFTHGEFFLLRSVAVAFLVGAVARTPRLTPMDGTLFAVANAQPGTFVEAFTAAALHIWANPEARGTNVDARVAFALRIIHASHVRPLKVSEVAREVRLSRWHLERLLRLITGRSFTEHLREARLRSAINLFNKSPFLTVKEVAALVGSGSVKSFARDFRRVFGCSPVAWKRGRRAISGLEMTSPPPRRKTH
jgi:AraC-like DNA-binding protein